MGSNHVPNLVKWVESFSGELYSWALYKISDPELAKDLVQDTFLAAAEKKESFRGNSSPRSWLFAILNHKIIDVYRKRIKQPLYWDDHFFPVILMKIMRGSAGKPRSTGMRGMVI